MMPDAQAFNSIADGLERNGWCVVHDFLAPSLVEDLSRECLEHNRAGRLLPATTGHAGATLQLAHRGDRTLWFDLDALTDPQNALWSNLDCVRKWLNQRLMLGLESLEAHYALYAPGAGYVRHLDRFADDDARVLSCVIYLNPDWQIAHAGALRLHLADEPLDIPPTAGTLVLFLSAEIEHEVLPATRDRLSIAGWFRRSSIAA